MEIRSNQDTGKFRTNTKDQFYTNVDVAKACIQQIVDHVPRANEYIWVEPSAGNGSFLNNIPDNIDKIGLDIEPRGNGIIEQDFLTWTPPINRDVIVFGNPPFGRQSSLAKAFIVKSCEFAKIIAFILPKSFVKPSMSKAFDLKFNLIYCGVLEKNSFEINNTCRYDVPCVFQIWKKMDVDRPIDEKILPRGFVYTNSSDRYHFAFRRVGGLAGRSYRNDGTKYSVQSHYFIKLNEPHIEHVDMIIEKINDHEFPSNTVGPRSLSKSETNIVINEIIRLVSC